MLGTERERFDFRDCMVCIVGGFVVGHDGMGYTDIGEEIEWVNEDARQEEDAGKGARKKKKDGKKRQGEEPVPGAKERMQKMFQTAAVRKRMVAPQPKAVAKVDAAETDALLDDILGDLGTPSSTRRHQTYVCGIYGWMDGWIVVC